MQKQLIQWYQQNKRDFPWRKDQDPYHIWISEIMLQQTTTETVIPYYERFLENFSTIKHLPVDRKSTRLNSSHNA